MDEARHGNRMRAILLTKSGRLSNRSFLQGSSAAGHAPRTSSRCSMRSSTCCERDAPGDSCPTTFHRRGQSTITSERGPVTELSNEFTTLFVDGFALQRAETRSPAAACLDSQSAKTNEQGGIDGYDAGKKIEGASVTSWWTPWG